MKAYKFFALINVAVSGTSLNTVLSQLYKWEKSNRKE